MTPRQRFDEVIRQAVRDTGSVGTSLDLADSMAKHLAMIIDRYLQASRSPAIPPSLAAFYADVSPRMIMYGLYTHFICFGSDNRGRFLRLDQELLYQLWNQNAARALSTLDAYSKGNQGVPDTLFEKLYTVDAEPSVCESGDWWWKRVRIKSAIRDRFATGLVLGMAVDTETAKI